MSVAACAPIYRSRRIDRFGRDVYPAFFGLSQHGVELSCAFERVELVTPPYKGIADENLRKGAVAGADLDLSALLPVAGDVDLVVTAAFRVEQALGAIAEGTAP